MNPFVYLPIMILGLAIAVFAVISLILLYHWRRYGRGEAAIMLFETAYFVVGIGLLALAIGIIIKS